MSRLRAALIVCLPMVAGTVVGAQAPGPTPRPLGAVVASSPMTFQRIRNVVALSDGRVLVNDYLTGTIAILDSALRQVGSIRDSAYDPLRQSQLASTGVEAGAGTNLLPFVADSTLLWNSGLGGSIVVLDPVGRVSRVIAAPASEVPPPGQGVATIDMVRPVAYSAALGLIYTARVSSSARQIPLTPQRARAPGQPDSTVVQPDSIIVMTLDLRTRGVDTVLRLANGQLTRNVFTTRYASGMCCGGFTMPAFPYRDAMRLMPDGSLAVLRGLFYRMDWLAPDRTRTSSARIPYDWQSVSDADRVRMADSIGAPARARYDSVLAAWVADSSAGRPQMDTVTRSQFAGSAVGGRGAGDLVTTRQVARRPRPRPPTPLDPESIPQFLPPFRADRTNAHPAAPSMMHADAENRVWILPVRRGARPGDAQVYDVVDRRGVLVERVALPVGRSIAGFGPGVVYLTSFDAGAQRLEKARIR